MNTLQIIIVICAVLAMLEAVWLLASPGSYKKFAAFWMRAATQLPTLLPILLAAIAVVIWGVVLIGQPIYRTIGILLGILFVLAAAVHADRVALARVMDQVLLNRSTKMLRLIAVGALIIAGLVLWITITGR